MQGGRAEAIGGGWLLTEEIRSNLDPCEDKDRGEGEKAVNWIRRLRP